MIVSKSAEKLYLQKDPSQNIVVNLPITLPQHQRDGIRFLFKLFKKKAPGVILNDPSGYGKCLQIVLFLDAIRPTLKNPALILSNTVDNWAEHFQIWTASGNELAINESNLFTKCKIFVNSINDAAALSRRSWSVVVLHDESATGELLGSRFNADYKIWATSTDMKENLYTLASVYEYLHPNQKFDVDLFSAERKNRRELVEKALLLDAFLEDFLIRRTDFLTPFQKTEKNKPSNSPMKVSRKNKDPTGTKVKQSKRKRILDDDEIVNVTSASKPTTNTSNETVNDDVDVPVFIDNNKDNNVLETSKETSDMNLDDDESMEIDFSDAVKEIEANENVTIDQTQSAGSPVTAKNKEDNDIEDYILEMEDDDERNRILVPATEESCDSQNISEANTAQKLVGKDSGTKIGGVHIPETETENNEISSKILDGESAQSQIIDWKSGDKVLNKNETSVSSNGVNSKSNDADKIGKNIDNMNSNNEVKKKSILDEFDAEMAAFEAKALKKIKGSILDSLF